MNKKRNTSNIFIDESSHTKAPTVLKTGYRQAVSCTIFYRFTNN